MALYIIKNLFSYLKSSRNGNGRSGDQSIDFWRSEFRAALQEGLKDHTDSLKESLCQVYEVETKIHEGIIKLVALTEAAQRKQ